MGVLIDKKILPEEKLLAEVLGPSFSAWKKLLKELNNEYGPLTEEWKFYGAKSGWLMKLLFKKRNLLFLSPLDNYFVAAFIFGDKASAEIEKSSLPDSIKEEIRTAKKYAEGRGLRITARSKAEVPLIINLVRIKINN